MNCDKEYISPTGMYWNDNFGGTIYFKKMIEFCGSPFEPSAEIKITTPWGESETIVLYESSHFVKIYTKDNDTYNVRIFLFCGMETTGIQAETCYEEYVEAPPRNKCPIIGETGITELHLTLKDYQSGLYSCSHDYYWAFLTGWKKDADIAQYDLDYNLIERQSIIKPGTTRQFKSGHILYLEKVIGTGENTTAYVCITPPDDPCEGVSCENTCVGVDLYSQKCIDGECIADRLIETNNREECGYDPCEGVSCPDYCDENFNFHISECINGECKDILIETQSIEHCGFALPNNTLKYVLPIGIGLALIMSTKK